jgi:hypothetical protein
MIEPETLKKIKYFDFDSIEDEDANYDLNNYFKATWRLY